MKTCLLLSSTSLMYVCGKLYAAENAPRRALRLAQKQRKQQDKLWGQPNHLEVLSETEIAILLNLSTIMAIRGVAGAEFRQALLLAEENDRNGEKPSYYLRKCMLAECELMLDGLTKADQLVTKACKIAQREDPSDKMIWVKRIQDIVALRQGGLARASELLHNTLIEARAVNDVKEELDILIGLAELHQRQGDLQSARELLDDVWVLAERSPYSLEHADAYNILAQIESHHG